MNEEIETLTALIHEKEEEIEALKTRLQVKVTEDEISNGVANSIYSSSLSQSEITRYSRQIIMPEIGVAGQLALRKTSVLIVGAGGLGCPCGIYLAAAGIGKIGIVDFDVVELSNMHRQIAHREGNIGNAKCSSFINTVKGLNKSVNCVSYKLLINSSNIEDIIMPYDIIVDASDNVPTRYLLNDAAVLFNKPLVSGSALRFEGQLTVYNYLDGPCYRCLFPVPPPLEAVTNCSEGGILGVVTGIIGSLQALEVIKIAIGLHPSYNKRILIFDGLDGEFRVIKLRGKKSDCELCGNEPSIKKLIDYEQFCNSSASDKAEDVALLSDTERISCSEYKKILNKDTHHVLVDVRPTNEVSICHLPNFINIPLKDLKHANSLERLQSIIKDKGSSVNYVVCRRGNDSQKAVRFLQEQTKDMNIIWYDIKGGLHAWHKEVDSDFPLY